ncbi:uncharacterized protein BT62DRAFT_461893 [Guyanagaster necrorhizus]|uniref:C2H2-type domain-containing protein n=1 Tax=Guyanagaster necrorhizus TaxID=856835 RepID=A0A9P8ANP7_9AGAR|nr:uncharacterized protein BT62DRAFT_461893 [Guyanagaster necrorhizus MCA 3950]KAG7441966.1 hypothetical protein BT62DRAFT_461893 [Guyanagaster necrorhizus MCA 3950]
MPDGRSHQCCECNGVMSRKHDIKRHRLAKHASETERRSKSYYCRCGVSAIQRSNVEGHIRSAHTGKLLYCGTCGFGAPSDATLTRHRRETRHKLNPRSRKPKKKKSSPNSASSSSPTPEIHTTADFIAFYGDVPLTYTQYTLYQSLVHRTEKQAPPSPPSTPATFIPAADLATPTSAMSTPATPILAPRLLPAPIPEVPVPAVDRAASHSPPPECFLVIPEEYRLPPINVHRRDHRSTAPLTAPVMHPRLSSSYYHRYGPY